MRLLRRSLYWILLSAAPAVLGALVANPRSEAPALPAFSAHYVLHKGSFKVAEARVQLRRQDTRYVYSSRTEPAGLLALFRNDRITERSVWTWEGARIRPLEYRYTHVGSKKNRDAHLVFDWERNRVANTVQGHTWHMEIPEGTLDKFSVHLAVMLDLQRQRKDMQYFIADGGNLKTYRFKTLGRERIETQAGTFETIKLERVRDDMDRQTYIWCAPELKYLLVRIEHIEDGDRLRMEVDEVKPGKELKPQDTDTQRRGDDRT